MTFEQGLGLFILAFGIGGHALCTFIARDGLKILAAKLVKFVESRISKKRKDI